MLPPLKSSLGREQALPVIIVVLIITIIMIFIIIIPITVIVIIIIVIIIILKLPEEYQQGVVGISPQSSSIPVNNCLHKDIPIHYKHCHYHYHHPDQDCHTSP